MEPGPYKIQFRGLSLGELWRFSGFNPWVFTVSLVLKLVNFKGSELWLPVHESEQICEPEDLGLAEPYLLPVVEQARALGYETGHFVRMIRTQDDLMRQSRGYYALHNDGIRQLTIGFTVTDAPGLPPSSISVSGCVTLRNGHDMEFMDNNNYMDAPGIVTNTPIKGKGVEAVDRALVAFLAKPGTEARRFGSFAEWRDFAKEQALRVWDARVARGLARKER